MTLSSGTYTGQPFAAVAAGNILGANATINTSDSSSSDPGGGNITIVSGAQFTLNANGSITITGGNANGGYIQLGSLNSSASNTAGNILLLAFAGTATNSGTITFNSINANGGAGNGSFIGQDGNVYIIAGAASGTTAIGPKCTNRYN